MIAIHVFAPVEQADPAKMRVAPETWVAWRFHMIGKVAPHIQATRSGEILMIMSAAPLRSLSNHSTYATALAADNALVKSLSQKLAPFNIQVNAIPQLHLKPDLLPTGASSQ